MDTQEFMLWSVRGRTDPLPDPWLQTGVMTANIVNATCGAKCKPLDFVPQLRPIKQSETLNKAKFAAYRELYNASKGRQPSP